MTATASEVATVAWADAAPSEEARRLLAEWARSHGVTLVEPSGAKARAAATDEGASDRVETELGQAREALAGLELDAAERHLARAGAALREHPELPQAAWLRAEVERAWSARWLAAGPGRSPSAADEERAKRAWRRAAALDGGREPGLGEKAYEAEPGVVAHVALEGRGALRIDGEAVTPGEVTRGAGEHAVAVTRDDGAVVWAAWVALEQGSEVRLAAPAAPPCSADDLSALHARAPVRCAHWVSAEEIPNDHAVRVAWCVGASCGPPVEWRASRAVAAVADPGGQGAKREGSRWPAWATWAVAGAAVVGTAVTAILVSSAAKAPPSETRFINGGVQVH